MIHTLKILPEFFIPVFTGEKTFEIRNNDRDFKIGDILILKEWQGSSFTGRFVAVRVTYILDNPLYLPENMVALSIVLI